MPLDGQEAFALALDALEVAKAIDTAVKGLPPKAERNALTYAKAFGAAPGTPLYLTAELIDKAEAEIKD